MAIVFDVKAEPVWGRICEKCGFRGRQGEVLRRNRLSYMDKHVTMCHGCWSIHVTEYEKSYYGDFWGI